MEPAHLSSWKVKVMNATKKLLETAQDACAPLLVGVLFAPLGWLLLQSRLRSKA